MAHGVSDWNSSSLDLKCRPCIIQYVVRVGTNLMIVALGSGL